MFTKKKVNRPYTGSKDAPGTQTQAGCLEMVRLIRKTWGFTFHGGFNNRTIYSGSSKGKLSVHATGRAIDIAYPKTAYGRNQAVQVWVWLLQNTKALGIEAMHDYSHGEYGQGYRCSRGEGCEGVVQFTKDNNAGSVGGNWLHIELSPKMAKSRIRFRRAWMKISKPEPLLGPL